MLEIYKTEKLIKNDSNIKHW